MYVDVPANHEALIVPKAVAQVFRTRYPLLFGKPTSIQVNEYVRAQNALNKAAVVAKVTPNP